MKNVYKTLKAFSIEEIIHKIQAVEHFSLFSYPFPFVKLESLKQLYQAFVLDPCEMQDERLYLRVSGQLFCQSFSLAYTHGVSATEDLDAFYCLVIFFRKCNAVLGSVFYVRKNLEISHKQLVHKVVLPDHSVESADELRGFLLVAVETREQLMDQFFVELWLEQSLEVDAHYISESPYLLSQEDHLSFRLGDT